MPTVENMDISGAADDQIRPEWEQSAARRVLDVEPPSSLAPAMRTSSHSMQLSLQTLVSEVFDGEVNVAQ